MNRHKILLASMVMGLACPAAFATSGNLVVSGTVVPQGCIPHVDHVELGTTSYADLAQDRDTVLEPRSVPLSVTCSAAMKFGIKVTDHQAQSVSSPGLHHFGLGKSGRSGDLNNGYYTLSVKTGEITGGLSYVTSTVAESEVWTTPVNITVPISQERVYGFADDSSSVGPDPTQTLVIPLSFQATIAKGLDFSDEIQLLGDATIDLEYY